MEELNLHMQKQRQITCALGADQLCSYDQGLCFHLMMDSTITLLLELHSTIFLLSFGNPDNRFCSDAVNMPKIQSSSCLTEWVAKQSFRDQLRK